MSVTNDFLPFATGGGANVEAQATYSADTLRTNGNQPGVAVSALNNKAIRQPTYFVSQLAQYLANIINMNVLDNATPAQLLAQLVAGLQSLPPVVNSLTSGTGTWNSTFVFFVATPSVSPTATATYTDSASTIFTVVKTVALAGGGTAVYATGGTAPVTGGAAGTLTKTGGTGDSSLTYYAVRAPVYLEAKMCGGGGGGGADTTNGGANGVDTTFGSSLLTASKGLGGAVSNNGGGAGGSYTIAAPATGWGVAGGSGMVPESAVQGFFPGGTNPFGGQAASTDGSTPATPSANTGAGGCGSIIQGCGGGAGGFLDAIIAGPSASYAYAVGAAGAGGAAGVHAGGSGAAGVIIITLCYQ